MAGQKKWSSEAPPIQQPDRPFTPFAYLAKKPEGLSAQPHQGLDDRLRAL